MKLFGKGLEDWERQRYEQKVKYLTERVKELEHQTEVDAAYIAGLHKGLRRRREGRDSQ